MSEKKINDDWKSLPWKDFDQTLFRLQHRLYKASKEKDITKCKNIQRLILGSACSRYLAVRQVAQLNCGNLISGIDGRSFLTIKERFELAEDLKALKDWKQEPIQRVSIRKPNGEFRLLGIPTIRDQAMQYLIKYALEPYYEATASNGSWGFRPGRSAHDVQKIIFLNLKSKTNGYKKIIYQLDIENCFKKLDHNKLMSLILLPASIKKIIRTTLKVGILKEWVRTLEEIPQSGILSTLLFNIALNGIENLHNEIGGSESKQRGFRYENDIIFFLQYGEDPELLRSKLDKFLVTRGLNIKELKTRLVKSTDGFDFLGWHFKVKSKNKKFVSYPSSKNRKEMIKTIKAQMKDTRYPIQERLNKVKVIYYGWRNYHKYCDLFQINTWSISDWVYKFCRKNTSWKKELILSQVREIFNGHSQNINGYLSVQAHGSLFDLD